MSSFGFSGSNAHLVLEEYVQSKVDYSSTHPAIIVLSAKNKERLLEQVADLQIFIKTNGELNVHDIAYTLQVGRTAMEERLAFVTNSISHFEEQLGQYEAGTREGLFAGNTKKNKNDFLGEDKTKQATIKKAIEQKEVESLAQFWAKGISIDWNLLYEETNRPNKISLPIYPFARERYWVEKAKLRGSMNYQLHPLVHQNISDLEEQKFQTVLTGEEIFLAEHQIRSEKILPGVAYLELARVAGNYSSGKAITSIKDITWISPIIVNGQAQAIQISLFKTEDTEQAIYYKIYSRQKGKELVHAQGKLLSQVIVAPAPIEIASIKKRMNTQKGGSDCYQIIRASGVLHGSSFQGIEQLYYNEEEALSKINLNQSSIYGLAPGILDSAIQTCHSMGLSENNISPVRLPFSTRAVHIYGDVHQTAWAYARKSKHYQPDNRLVSYDIDLLTDSGEVLLRFEGFVSLPLDTPLSTSTSTVPRLELFTPQWKVSSLEEHFPNDATRQVLILVGASTNVANQLRAALNWEVRLIEAKDEIAYYLELQTICQALNGKERVHITVLFQNKEANRYSFVSGLLKTTQLETSNITAKTLSVESLSLKAVNGLIDLLQKEQNSRQTIVRYKNNQRLVPTLASIPITDSSLSLKQGGVYLITGGAGGLGEIMARHFSKIKEVQLILVGRSATCRLDEANLQELKAVYYACDVRNSRAVNALIEQILAKYNRLDGIIHSAGVLRDSFLSKKTAEEARVVLQPKIMGAKNLDRVTKEMALDFMVYFSSLGGLTGNIGQAAYASANAWLDEFSHYRNQLVVQGKRSGKTLSINWPLWAAGGMQINEENKALMQQQWGLHPMPTAKGVQAMGQLLEQEISQGIVIYGESSKIKTVLRGEKANLQIGSPAASTDNQTRDMLEQQAQKVVINLAAQLVKLEAHRLSIQEELGTYGFDSILLTSLANELNNYYHIDVLPTVFYNYPTIEELSNFLVKEYPAQLEAQHTLKQSSKAIVGAFRPTESSIPKRLKKRGLLPTQDHLSAKQATAEPIAIIGMSARFPAAPNLDAFWENLKNNRDLISEVPKDRWDWETYYGDAKKETGKTKAKWGGFIKDIDKFDPLFFNISPREAELMDPQQRLALEEVYHALEDAGMSMAQIKGSDTGVFIGVSGDDYAYLIQQQSNQSNQAQFSTGVAHSVLVNRISYLLDIHGPSEPIDTACSSSLIAIHRAIQNIRLGNCTMAIAGGVNAILSPTFTLSFSQAGFLSEDGRCKTFDQSANGYVRGEGVGIIILKPLSQAEADGDQIHAVIRSSAENHGGKANTLTSPNPKAQKDLLIKAYQSADIDPRRVSYIEAHGTGTPLGDPIETEGLKLAFKALYEAKELNVPTTAHIQLGSVKANMGHLESAAGIAGVLKVVQAMKHQTLPGNPQLQTPNEYLKLENSPFALQKETTEWTTTDGQPRLAGVSSFGFGGANAHIVLEEYEQQKTNYQSTSLAIIVLSAKNKERLAEQVDNLRAYLKVNEGLNLYDIAYTLQIGRTAMEERLALVANDITHLQAQLEQYQAGKLEGIFTGNIKQDKNDFVLKGKAGKGYIEIAIQERELESLAQLWVKGVSIDWHLLYERTNRPNKISLPTYPFARERYWIEPLETKNGLSSNLATNVLKNLPEGWHYIKKTNTTEEQGLEIISENGDIVWQQRNGDAIITDASSSNPTLQLYTTSWTSKAIEEEQLVSDVADNTIILLAGASPLLADKLTERLTIEVQAIEAATATDFYLAIQQCLQTIIQQKVKTKLLLVYPNNAHKDYAFISGLFKTAMLEYPKLLAKTIGVDVLSIHQIEQLCELLEAEQQNSSQEIHYIAGQRAVRQILTLQEQVTTPTIAIKEGGVYLITGGVGGLGKIFAGYIAQTAETQIILTGRRTIPNLSSAELRALNATYYACDVTNQEAVEKLIQHIISTNGQLNGIIHSAAVINNGLIINKTKHVAKTVLQAKIEGAKYLDQATKALNLDFTVYFSSTAAITGLQGAAAYASANAWLDNFAFYRNQLVQQGKRKGFTYSINWPLWKEGGLKNPQQFTQYNEQQFGLYALPTEKGIAALEHILYSQYHQGIVFYGTKNILTLPLFSKLAASKNNQLFGLGDKNPLMSSTSIKAAKITLPPWTIDAEIATAFENICYKGILQVLLNLGITSYPAVNLHDLRQQLGIIDKYHDLFISLLKSLQSKAYLSLTESGWHFPKAIRQELTTFVLTNALQDFISVNPNYKAQAKLIKTTLQHFESIIKGNVKATDIIFPQGKMNLVKHIYKNNVQADYFNEALCQVVKASIEKSIDQLKKGEKITILEVGAGTGGTSALLFQTLKDYSNRLRFIYTDISNRFLFYAEENYQDIAPYLETKLFNIEQHPRHQQIPLGECDIVIGTNVVHATKNIRNSLQNIKAVLKKGGLLILNEVTQINIFATLTFGLLDGWWLYEDKEIRLEGSPLLSGSNWKAVMQELGFLNTIIYPKENQLPQQIIVTQRDRISNWITATAPTLAQKSPTKTASLSLPRQQTNLDKIEAIIIACTSNVLKIPSEHIDKQTSFADYGLDSIINAMFVKELQKKLHIELLASVIFENPTVQELALYISQECSPIISEQTTSVKINNGLPPTKEHADTEEYAIIAMAGQFPNAETEEHLWKKIKEAHILKASNQQLSSSIVHFAPSLPPGRASIYESILQLKPNVVEHLSAEVQLIMELLARALTKYGLNKNTLTNNITGVFINAKQHFEKLSHTNVPNILDVYLIPNTISFHLDLKGPSELINIGCASVYAAIHRAMQSIQLGECEQAIIGAINRIAEKESNLALKNSTYCNLLSDEGLTKSFSNYADGFLPSEAVGVILIKPLSQAERDGNNIVGVIKASAIYHGGKGFSLEAPSAKGIKKAIEKSLIQSGVPAETIDYIEAHGIANPMADAIELTAIEAAYKKQSKDPNKKWHIGSIKPTIGHSELASGMASLIKVLKAFEHQTIPGIAGLEQVNTELPAQHSLILTKDNTRWKNGEHPRRAALNSYAVGGVNAHLIVEEYIDNKPKEQAYFPSKSTLENLVDLSKEAATLVTEPKELTKQREKILTIAGQTFQIELDIQRSPLDYDIDSVKIIRFVRRVNEHFGLQVKMGQILSVETFEQMFELFETAIELPEQTIDKPITSPSLPTRHALSEGQKGLWAIQAAQPDSTMYNVPIALYLEGLISADKIYRAAEQLIAAHPILGVRFSLDTDSGLLYQQLPHLEKINGTVLTRDIAALTKKQDINAIFKALSQQPFDLSQEVLRLHVRMDLEQGKVYVLFVIHHIVIDGTSTTLLVKAFTSILQQLQQSKTPTLRIDATYFDFIDWEQKHIESHQGAADVAYWREKLSGSLEKINLPYDSYFKEEDSLSTQEARVQWTISGAALVQLKAAAKAQKVTLSVFLLSIFKVLLYRLSNNKDIIIKQPTAGRPLEKHEQSMGYFINMMLSRTQLSATQSFDQVLTAVQKELIQSVDHVSYPYPKLLAELNLTAAEREGLFPVSYNYLNIFDDLLEKDNSTASIQVLEAIQQAVTEEYALEIQDFRTELRLELKYRSDLFTAQTIQRHLAYYQKILESVTADIHQPIGQLDLLSAKEKHQLLVTFNDTAAAYPKDKTIVDLFEEQVEKTPHNIAVVFEDQELTYQQLNEQANKVGDYLRKTYHIQADDIIALQLQRSEWMIIAILGVMKAGAAYLPITPDAPAARTAFMLEDANAKVLLTDAATYAKAEQQQDLISIEVVEQIKSGKQKNLVKITSSQDLAYIIYTSGSTGKPKGVMTINHNVIRVVKQTNYIDIVSDDVVIQLSNYAFDGSVFDIYGALLNGAKLVMLKKHLVTDTLQLGRTILENKVSVIFITTALFNIIVDTCLHFLQNIRKILFGGEQVSITHVSKAFQQLGKNKIIHLYGPTETTVYATFYPVNDINDNIDMIPIGQPLTATELYVFNKKGKIQPIGIAGEILIGGSGLARGYLNKPDLSAQKFIPHPFKSGERLYRTGDLARWLPDGNIEFLGRIDFQLKIRGYRIEAGEIEQALLAHQAIQSAVVLGYDFETGKELVAYIVPKENQAIPDIATLRSFLAQSLPDYMIPSHFVALDKLPLTSSGKVNRKALPTPDASLATGTSYVAPRNSKEKLLGDVWQSVLRKSGIGIHDNFFHLGGDSIKAIQIMARLGQADWQLSIKDLFAQPTIAGQAGILSKKTRTYNQKPIEGLVPLTAIQKWFFDQHLIDQHYFNQAMMLEWTHSVDIKLLEQAFKILMEQHDMLRVRYELEAPIVQHVEGLPLDFSLEIIELSAVSQQNMEQLIQQQATHLQGSFDLTQSGLLKVALFRDSQNRIKDQILIVIHHLVVDGVSWRILLEDLQSLYQQLKQGQQPKLPAKTAAFQLWSEELQSHAGQILAQDEEEIAYWQSVIRHSQSAADLPTDATTLENTIGNASLISFELTASQTQNLLTQVPRAYHTEINDILLAALGLALNKTFEQDRYLIDLEGHGREELLDLDISRTIGWFTSIFPFVLQNNSTHNLGYHLQQVKEALRRIPHKGIGYGILRYLTPSAALDFEAAAAKISFNYLGDFRPAQSGENRTNFGFSTYSTGLTVSKNALRTHELDVLGIINSHCLQLSLIYNPHRLATAVVEDLMAHYKRALVQLIEHCKAVSLPQLSPSDFTLCSMSLDSYAVFLDYHQLLASSIEDIYPLSPMQEGMLFHWLLSPQSVAYAVQMQLHFGQHLEVERFTACWKQLIKRHPILRTVFFSEKTEQTAGVQRPLQVVLKKAAINFEDYFEFIDLQPLSAMEQQKQLEAYRLKDQTRGFDLGKLPLIRFTIFDLGINGYVLLQSNHHILKDGWSLGVLLKELLELYEEDKVLTPIPPYGQYIDWIEGQSTNKAAEFWKDYLSDYEPSSLIPDLKVSKEDKTQEIVPKEHHFKLNQSMTRALEDLAATHQVSLNTVIQALWGILLGRYNSRQDVVFGMTTSGRSAEVADIENMVGLFINTVPVRISWSEDELFQSLLKRLSTAALEVQAFEYYPLAQIQQMATGGGQELFDHIMVFENYPIDEKLLNANAKNQSPKRHLAIEAVKGYETVHYGMSIVVLPGTELGIKITWHEGVWAESWVNRIENHLKMLIDSVLAEDTKAIDALEILPPSERSLLLETFNDTAAAYPKDKTIVDLFEEQVEKTPDNIAVVFKETELTYQQLNEQANQLGYYLRKAYNIQPDDIIALQLERSEWMIIAILGVMKAGAAYLPIAPDAPTARTAFMLKDASAKVLLTDVATSAKAELQQDLISIEVVEQIKSERQKNLDKITSSQDLAYVIYTSGSTGQPKGVMIEHLNVSRLLFTDQNLFDFKATDVWTLFHFFGFDFSVWEIWGALLYGAKLIVIPQQITRDPKLFAELIHQHEVTVLNQVPSTFDAVQASLLQCEQSLDLRYIIFGGAPLHPASLQTFHTTYPQVRLINMYGITETTVHVTFKEITPLDIAKGLSNVGKPIPTLECYIIDKANNLVPIGVSGEICVSGAGLTRGYLNRPDLTAEKFIPHPFKACPDSSGEGERLYKSGDLARWLPNGDIEHLGRIDFQLKVRGYRIEAGEIEQALLSHETIQSAIVIGHQQESGVELVAYLVPREGQAIPDIAQLRSFLSQSLPDYMVPAYFVVLENLPLTSSGKVNRKALPAPDADSLASGTAYEAPRTSVEQTLVAIWEELLNRSPIGIHDNFFALGGHSLKAIRLLSLMRQTLAVELRLRDIFAHPTIACISQQIQKESEQIQQAGILFNNQNQASIFAFAPILGLAIFFKPFSYLMKTSSIYAFDFVEAEDRFDQYYEEIKNQQVQGPYTLMGFSAGTNLAFEMAQYLEAKGDVVQDLILIDGAIRLGEEGQSPEEIEEGIQSIIAYINERSHMPALKRLFNTAHIAPQALHRMRTYYDYFNTLVQKGTIQSDIHLILAEREKNEQEKTDTRLLWEGYTLGKFRQYMGQGEHPEMFTPPNLEVNAQLINRILENILH